MAPIAPISVPAGSAVAGWVFLKMDFICRCRLRDSNVLSPTLSDSHLIQSLSFVVGRSPAGIELADFPTRELLFGVTSIESYLDFSAQDLEFGFNETRRDRILRTYVRNVYHFHLNEIFSALKVSIRSFTTFPILWSHRKGVHAENISAKSLITSALSIKMPKRISNLLKFHVRSLVMDPLTHSSDRPERIHRLGTST